MSHPTHDNTTHHIVRRRGFSFTEVLFAVMILGIGFIMIAGIFPVAISQTASTQEETIGAEMARGAATAAISQARQLASVPADGQAHPLSQALFQEISGNQILREDPRFAWVAFGKRDGLNMDGQPSPVVQVIIVPVQVRGRDSFDQRDLTIVNPNSTNAYGTLFPSQVRVNLTEGFDNLDECEVVDGIGQPAIAPGAVLVIGSGSDTAGRNAAGRTYRIGDPVDGKPNTYALTPGNDMSVGYGADGAVGGGGANADTIEDVNNAVAYIVGQGMTNPGVDQGTSPLFSAGSMAIATYVTFVSVR